MNTIINAQEKVIDFVPESEDFDLPSDTSFYSTPGEAPDLLDKLGNSIMEQLTVNPYEVEEPTPNQVMELAEDMFNNMIKDSQLIVQARIKYQPQLIKVIQDIEKLSGCIQILGSDLNLEIPCMRINTDNSVENYTMSITTDRKYTVDDLVKVAMYSKLKIKNWLDSVNKFEHENSNLIKYNNELVEENKKLVEENKRIAFENNELKQSNHQLVTICDNLREVENTYFVLSHVSDTSRFVKVKDGYNTDDAISSSRFKPTSNIVTAAKFSSAERAEEILTQLKQSKNCRGLNPHKYMVSKIALLDVPID